MTRTVADAAAELGAIAGKDPEDPATDSAPATVPDYLAGAEHHRAGRASGSASSTTPTRSTSPRSPPCRRWARRRCTVTSPQRPRPFDILMPEFKRDLNAYFVAAARERADEDARGHHRLQHRQRGRRDSSSARRSCWHSQATDLTDPAQNAAYVAARDTGRRNAQQAIDNALTRGTADPADDVEAIMTPSGTLTGARRARRLPAARRPRRLQRPRARPGRDRVQRHGLQRGEAARVRPRLRAGDEAAQAAERDQPEPVALRARQRVRRHHARVRAQHAGQRGRHLDAGRRHRAGDALAHARARRPRSARSRPGVAREYTARTTANVISTAGDATLTRRPTRARTARVTWSTARSPCRSRCRASAPVEDATAVRSPTTP